MRIAIEHGGVVRLLTGQTAPFPEGAVISPVNWDEIVDVPERYLKIEGDVVREMDQAEKDTRDLARMDELKVAKMAEIDVRTKELIYTGFEFDGERFSASDRAQSNWIGMFTLYLAGMLPFPFVISTVDEGQYTLQDATALQGFIQAFFTYQSSGGPLQSGRDLKAQVQAATTPAELRAVVDDR